MERSLRGRTLFITGASRGIGREIALKAAKDGANIVIAAKTSEPHPNLSGTIHTVADEVKQLGGQALPIVVDVRDEEMVANAIQQAVDTFGGIDILVNNASAINMSNTLTLPMKRFDLLMSVNVRATFMCSKLAMPHLKKSANPHILTLSPPLSMKAKWFKNHLAYTMSKFGMSMCTLGLAEEFKEDGVAANSLWPKTLIATAAIEQNFPKQLYQATRKPSIMADAAHFILTSPSRDCSGNFFIDEEVLTSHGVIDLAQYALHPGVPLYPDLYLD